MPLRFTVSESQTPSQALELAARRDLLPSALSSREQRETLAQAVRENAVFSARTNNAHYLQTLRQVVNRILSGDLNLADARLALAETLDALGYTPEGGFPEDLGSVPPVVQGSIQDLRSRRRLDFMLTTQIRLTAGRSQHVRGLERAALRQFPAWELVRVAEKSKPRDWQRRWLEAGGELFEGGRMIAMKGDAIWDSLGDSALFDDALDVDYPPFAFSSGMGWQAVSRADVTRLGVTGPEGETIDEVLEMIPAPKASTRGFSSSTLRELKQIVQARRGSGELLTLDQRRARRRERRRRNES